MNIIKSILRRPSAFRITVTLVLLYLFVSIGYYHLPWSIRKSVYDRAPKADRLLRKGGFKILNGWDELALWGRDAEIPADPKQKGDYAYGGFPSQGIQIFGRVSILENKGYAVGYSESQRNPLWVCYRLFDVPKLNSGKRPSGFKMDNRTRTQVKHKDYTHSGFDRGHMAPNYGIATRYGTAAQKETFLMSNIIPQTPGLNQHIWKDLEMRVAKQYGRYFSEVWVTTGPVFKGSTDRLDSGVAIPSHCYKIIADEHNGQLRVLAFLIEQRNPPFTRIKQRLVSIDEIEQLTGLNFFPNLSKEEQANLESQTATRLWSWMVPAFQYNFKGKTY